SGASSQMIGRELGAHKRSHPDLKHLTMLEMSSPDLSEVRVQRLTPARSVNANPNVVRVQAGIQAVSQLADVKGKNTGSRPPD
ncbi:MAG: hypothetical protein ACLP2U_02630, partial [Syntrophobacteraceae bacterium]